MFLNYLKGITILILSITVLVTTIYYDQYFNENIQNVFTNITQSEEIKSFNRDLECLTKNIYYEAAMEPYEGKLAVAQVTLNRVNNPQFPDTICGVVYQKKLNVCQFTWVCMKKLASYNKYAWEESEIVARKALTQPILHDIIAQANVLYYHANYVNPGWKGKVVARIGNHVFYARI